MVATIAQFHLSFSELALIMSLLTPELLRRLEGIQLFSARRVDFVASPALTPARSPRRGRILRRVLSQRQPSVLRQFSPANHQSAATGNSPSAKRMNMNSRGCQPTEQRLRTNPTLKGSHNEPSKRTFHIRPTHRQSPPPLFGPFRADIISLPIPWVSPTAIHVVRRRRSSRQQTRAN